MKVIVRDIGAKMLQLEQAIHRLVPIARIGLVVFAGKHQKRQVLPLNVFAGERAGVATGARSGWTAVRGAGDMLAACRQAIADVDWRPSAEEGDRSYRRLATGQKQGR